jgi:hypothetical protein
MTRRNRHTGFAGVLAGIFFLCTVVPSMGQQTDAGLWTSFRLEKEFTKKFSASVEQGIRSKENFGQLDQLYTQLGADYRVVRGLRLGIGYRFIEKHNPEKYYWNGLRFGHRLYFDVNYKYRFRMVQLDFRSRFQEELKYVWSSDKGHVPSSVWKNRIEIKYGMNRFEPYAGVELAYQFRDPRHPEADYSFFETRYYAGLEYHFRYQTIAVYYLAKRQWNILSPTNINVLGIDYTITLPRDKKKKKGQ